PPPPPAARAASTWRPAPKQGEPGYSGPVKVDLDRANRWPGSQPGTVHAQGLPAPAPPRGTEVIGDPDRYRAAYGRQDGNTCGLASIRQMLSDVDIRYSEDQLFEFALQRGYFADKYKCDLPSPGDWCTRAYDPITGGCYGVDKKEDAVTPTTVEVCREMRASPRSGIPLPLIGELLRAVSEKQVHELRAIDFKELWKKGAPDRTRAAIELQRKQEEHLATLQDLLGRKKGVLVTTDGPVLWNEPGSRGYHFVVVTALRRDSNTGDVLGYYVNDSGGRGHAWFVPRERFERAWRGGNGQMVWWP
ncbi:MAG: hypothetical protein HY553_03005, partial [Elusimicrobia bacterium]|nr:hypothetical protein [Elusimicrobiota bacterium]